MKPTTIRTIRYALNFLFDVNRSIARITSNTERLNKANQDVLRDIDAIADFEKEFKNV